MTKKRIKYVVALDGRRSKYFHTTTTKNMWPQLIMVQRRGANGKEREGSTIPSFWRQLSWEGIKKYNKIDEFTN